jgi:hypothetical protein
MHELDLHMQQLIANFNRGKVRKTFPRYQALMNKIKKTKTIDEKLALRKQYRRIPSRDPMDNNYRRLSYVRYADDFLIGVIRSRKVAEEMKHDVAKFLREQLRLELNLGKTKLTHARKNAAHF